MTDDGNMTRGEQMLALRKARMAAAPPFLRGGFRPFFLLGPAWAVAALTIWLWSLFGGHELPTAFDTLAWHRHEMLFGFVGAVVAGFLLTAIPNWTGRLPIAGTPLAALAGLWLAGRAAALWSGMTGLVPAAIVDAGFYAVLAFVCGREIIGAKNRNLPLVAIVLLFGAADLRDYLGAMGLATDSEAGFRAAIALVVVMISIVGGRIVPSFTRNWLAKRGVTQGLPGQPTRFDLIVIVITALALLGWLLAPSVPATGAALVIAALLQIARKLRWKGWRTLSDPLVMILHVGYAWIPAGLLLLGCSILSDHVTRTAAIHALTAGAMATMILAVMTRATLGHSGRELRAGPLTVAAYACVTIGALLRVVASLGALDYQLGMEAAGTLWASGFVLFLLGYGPMLFKARLDAAAG